MFFAIKESSVAAFIEKIRFWLPLEVNDQFLLLIKAVFMVRILLLVACLCLSLSVSAQSLSGVVKDKASDEVLISATVKLVPENGSALFTTTDLSGQFYFNKLKSGTYVLNISYVGYKAFMETVKIANTSNKINVYMQENSQLLGEVAVTGRATRAEQRGDSLMYNAEAFKVMQGSSAEDLLAKMPGVVVEGGTVQAQGEQVEKILVDGKEFFEGDVSLAVKNLPSDIIASIEIFDKKSDQSEFTGFDDGEEVKTINIVTNTTYLSNVVNHYFKCNFKHLLNKYRIRYAKQLISNEVYSPNELYKPCGFSSRSAFYAAFKKIMRVSPLYYQKYYKDKQI